jgi:hypothetical protein
MGRLYSIETLMRINIMKVPRRRVGWGPDNEYKCPEGHSYNPRATTVLSIISVLPRKIPLLLYDLYVKLLRSLIYNGSFGILLETGPLGLFCISPHTNLGRLGCPTAAPKK